MSESLPEKEGEGDKRRLLAEAVREQCIVAALRGYEEASMSGLCREGAWEAAVDAIRMLDLDQFLLSLPE